MAETPNHEFTIPEVGRDDWHVPLNENFEAIDTEIELRDEDANKTEYEPAAGAKFFATDTGIIYEGDGETWVATTVQGRYDTSGETASLVFGTEETESISLTSDGIHFDGNIEASGTKHFVETVDTSQGPREVVYTSSEAPVPRTETSGVARLSEGRAEVSLPEHFGWVTSEDEGLLVQTTPHASESSGLAVTERSIDRLVVEDRDGTGDYEFSYTVKGTRVGEETNSVVRSPTANDDRIGPFAGSTKSDD